MNMLGRTATLIVGATGLAFVGYCIYFDRKRRSDPQYKEKLRQRRRQQQGKSGTAGSTGGGGFGRVPDLSDPAAIQSFFLQEIQTGEEKLALGMIDEGLDHLVNALTICSQPQQLLQVLQHTLPPQVFQLLIAKLPNVATRGPASAGRPATVTEEVDDELE